MGSKPKLTPRAAFALVMAIRQAGGPVHSGLESVIASDPGWAHQYALCVLKRPWPEAEAVIASNPGWAYWYARDLLKTEEDKDRFEEVQQWVQNQS